METGTVVAIGVVAAVVVVGVVVITSSANQPQYAPIQPQQQTTALTQISQGVTGGLISGLANLFSSGNGPSSGTRSMVDRGGGWQQDTSTGWLYGPAAPGYSASSRGLTDPLNGANAGSYSGASSWVRS